MHDYKFRHSDLSFRPPPRRSRRAVRWLAALAILGVLIFAAVQLDLGWEEKSQGEDGVIPLSLPPTPAETSTEPPPQSRSVPMPATVDAPVPKTLLADQPPPGSEPDLSGAETTADAGPSAAPASRWVEHVVQPGDSLTRIFETHGLSLALLNQLTRTKEGGRAADIRPGQRLRIRVEGDGRVSELEVELDALSALRFVDDGNGVTGTVVRRNAEAKATAASGTITTSLFASAGAAGVPDAVIMELAGIFGWDVDFSLDIRAGDRFTVLYEELLADGQAIGSGDVLAAEFVNQGRTFRAVRYQDATGGTDYYAPDGRPLRKLFFRSPVKFTRVSSGFTNKRWHPVLKRWRSHRGVDYAAPTGTPVMATGAGTVELRGWKSGYGNVIYLRHGRTYRTVYGHLSRFGKGLTAGSRVEQGQVIGYVGQTGLATGPHLHYEFHVDGVHRDPLKVKSAVGDPLPARELGRFNRHAQPLLARLAETAQDQLIADAR